MYVGRIVKVELPNNIYYVGIVLEADKNSIIIKDKKGMRIVLKDSYILAVREISNGF